MKYLLATLTLCVSLAAQPAFHVAAGDFVIDSLKKQGMPREYAYPVGGIMSHVGTDILIGESGLGDYTIGIACVRLAIMYLACDDREDFFLKAFWTMLPDVIDKGLNTKIFHPNIPQASAFNRDGTELLEEVAVLSYCVRF